MRTFSYHQYPKYFPTLLPKSVTQVGAKDCKTTVIVRMHNYTFLSSVRKLDCYESFVVVVSLLNERVHGFNNVCDGSV